jgi:hypothetical protein
MMRLPWHQPRRCYAFSALCGACAGLRRAWVRCWAWLAAWLPLVVLAAMALVGLCLFVLGVVWREGNR